MKIIICMERKSYSEPIVDLFSGRNDIDFVVCTSLAESLEEVPYVNEYRLVLGSCVLPGILFRGLSKPTAFFLKKLKEKNPNGKIIYYHSNESTLPEGFDHYLNFLDKDSHQKILEILGYKKLRV